MIGGPAQECERKLSGLLDQSPSQADEKARTAFEAALTAVRTQAVVIYGAGQLGQKIRRILSEGAVDVLGFADGNPAIQGTSIDGTLVYSPEESAHRFGKDALFIVSVWHPTRQIGIGGITEHLYKLGCLNVISFVPVLFRAAPEHRPYWLWDRPGRLLEKADRVEAAFRLLGNDRRSQNEFVQQVQLRLTGYFSGLPEPAIEPQYFPSELFSPLPNEVFVDCGAFNGDTLLDFAKWTDGEFLRAWAFEADPGNVELLKKTVASSPQLRSRIQIIPRALSDYSGTARFHAAGNTGSALSDSGGIEVECTTLDLALDGDKPTYIKMDIEGAEAAAIAGAGQTIQRHRPLVSACVYHQQDHLWELPLALAKLMPDSRIAIRSYCYDGLETVAYAVPAERRSTRPDKTIL